MKNKKEKTMQKKTEAQWILEKKNLPLTVSMTGKGYVIFQFPVYRQAELGAYILKQKGFAAESTGQLLSVKLEVV